MALTLISSLRNAGFRPIAVAPMRSDYLRAATELHVQCVSIPAPSPLVTFGGPLKSIGRIKAAMLILVCLLPYWCRVVFALKKHRIQLVYVGEERALTLFGPAAKLLHLPIVWHLQRGICGEPGWIYRSCYRLATRVVCVSDSVLQDFVRQFRIRDATKAVRIYNGIADAVQRNSSGEIARTTPFSLLVPGRLCAEKGTHIAIGAVAAMPDEIRQNVRLFVTGHTDSTNSFFEFLQQLCRAKGVEEHVEFLGFRKDVPRLICESDIVICPSIEEDTIEIDNQEVTFHWKEGFCLTAIEAMRAGVPIVASDTYGLGEITRMTRAGLLVSPGNAHELAASITTLMNDPNLRQQLGRQGRLAYETYFQEVRMGREFADIFTDLIDRTRPVSFDRTAAGQIVGGIPDIADLQT